MDFTQLNNGASQPIAILVSGGLDSAVLLGTQVKKSRQAVWPLYIRCGLAWERAELHQLQRFLQAIREPNLQPLKILDLPVADIYGNHWSLTGQGIPDKNSQDEAVFLPGRNVLLTMKAALWCHLNHIPNLALALLGGNPFPDSSGNFFSGLEQTLNQSVGGQVQILRPFSQMKKDQIILLGKDLPLEHSLSCINPKGNHHCGQCNKCEERMQGFKVSGISDPTVYSRSGNV
ncbi:MAG: 7-cyano-7-deazaguanine synthase [Gemmataceae bacterium]|nr:7-cyano-7-deazaguanine synthase [Gemmataceae bacterium]